MTDTRPNILWYCTDQQRFDTIAALGNEYVQTPTIDQLVDDGVAFTAAYCQSPICTPSRSSFMTGMYPSRVHNTRNGNDTFPDHPPLISRLLADSGYDCGMVGKFHLQSSGYRTEPRLDDGYSFWKFSHAPRDDWEIGHDYADWVRAQGGDLDGMRNSDERVSPEMHQTTWATDMAIEFLDQERSGPWMLNVNIYDPHPPFVPPKAYADRFNPEDMPGPWFQESDLAQQEIFKDIDFQDEVRTPEDHKAREAQALYYAMIAQIDDQFARLLKAIDDAGQTSNTVVIFTSDHGESLGDHGLMYKGCRFYEGLVRVPLIFRWPGTIKKNVRSAALVELLDLTATVIELAGLDQPDYMQGRSLLPILKGAAEPSHFRDSVRCEYFAALDPYFTGGTGTFGTMYRRGHWKLVVYHGHGLGELYNLEDDPQEFNNLWDDPAHAAVRAQLVFESFDQHVLLTTDVGSQRIAPM
ncbi:MAG: sulfatase-like hydrolase/transferase [Fuerstiella sp.]|nr:sulfatase-like hydrolase/transferase [Fuerstiella sp.]MCP4787613.1 sulfatase-like hydrolase/transferase [Fuerstiella sp.]